MAVATWQDLIDIGAIPSDGAPHDPKWSRATGLLDKASAQALSFLGIEEADVAAWPEADQVALATIVAELAARRLTTSAAQSATQLANGVGTGWQTAVLSKHDRRNLSRIPSAARGGSGTITVETGDYSSPVNWQGWPITDQFSSQTSMTW